MLHIPLPPLEDRKTDIPILTAAFFRELNMTPDIDSSVWKSYSNIRLECPGAQNIVHYAAAILEGQTVFLHHLPPFVLLPLQTAGKGKRRTPAHAYGETRICFLTQAIKSLNEKGSSKQTYLV